MTTTTYDIDPFRASSMGAVLGELIDADRNAKEAQLDALSTDRLPDGTVVRFTRVNPDRRAYTYAAIRIHGLWYITGRAVQGMGNDEFCAWLLRGVALTDWAVQQDAPVED